MGGSLTKIDTPDLTPQERMVKRARLGRHSLPEIELTLRTVAYQSGNIAAAVRILNAHRDKDHQLKTAAVKVWVTDIYRDRYDEIVMHELEDIQQRQGIRALELAAKAKLVTDDLVDRTAKAAKKGKIDPKDLAPAARNMSQVFATAVEKAQSLTGQPTQRVAVDSLPELVNELQTMLGTKPVDVEPEDAEEVP